MTSTSCSQPSSSRAPRHCWGSGPIPRSALPSTTASVTNLRLGNSSSRMETSGWSSCQRLMVAGSTATASDRTVAIVRVWGAARMARRPAVNARRAEVTAAWASPRSARPAGVSVTGPGGRCRSGPPISASSARICCDSDGCDTCRRVAAAVNEPVCATARKYSSWRSVIVGDYRGGAESCCVAGAPRLGSPPNAHVGASPAGQDVTGPAGPVVVDRPRDGVLRIRLDRPERRNAVNAAALAGLHAAFDRPAAQAIVLGSTTLGQFCAGADLAVEDAERAAVSDGLYRLYARMVTLDVPVVAAVG